MRAKVGARLALPSTRRPGAGINANHYLFGTYAVVLAAPLVIAVFIAVKQLYIRDTLGEPTELPRDGK